MRLILGSHTGLGLADPDTGTVTARRELVQPTFATVSPRGDRVYAVGEDPHGPGRLYALTLSGTGFEEPFEVRDSDGDGPCHVSLHSGGRALLVSHYTGGSLVVQPLAADGDFAGEPAIVRHTGRGPDPERQDGPHVHQAVTDPSGRWVLVCDLGGDETVVYRLDGGRPQRHTAAAFAPGDGVRHLVFTPDGRRAYVAAELSSRLVACDFDPETGVLTPTASIDTTGVVATRNYPGAVVLGPTGDYVYVTNRGDDSIAVVDTANFTLRETVPTGGVWPRDACLSTTGTRLFVANEHSGTVTGFDLVDGRPVPAGPVIAFAGVTSVLAVP